MSAGGDLSGLLDRHIPPLRETIHQLATLPVPVVAALNGPIGGGGIGLALEHRFMVEAGRTADAAEGVAAFGQKRAPVFGKGSH